jgi:hypothetical protein
MKELFWDLDGPDRLVLAPSKHTRTFIVLSLRAGLILAPTGITPEPSLDLLEFQARITCNI